MRDKVIDVALSYTKLRPSRVIAAASNRRVSSSSIYGYDFTVKESEYVSNGDPLEMDNHSDMIFLEEILEYISQRLSMG